MELSGFKFCSFNFSAVYVSVEFQRTRVKEVKYISGLLV